MCAGAIHEDLHDSPIGSINLGSHRGKYLSLLYYISSPLREKSQRNSQVAVHHEEEGDDVSNQAGNNLNGLDEMPDDEHVTK